jgi:hypothetical protein
VPASNPAGAGMSRHLRPRNGAGESFVSFIRLFDGAAPCPDASVPDGLPNRVSSHNQERSETEHEYGHELRYRFPKQE